MFGIACHSWCSGYGGYSLQSEGASMSPGNGNIRSHKQNKDLLSLLRSNSTSTEICFNTWEYLSRQLLVYLPSASWLLWGCSTARESKSPARRFHGSANGKIESKNLNASVENPSVKQTFHPKVKIGALDLEYEVHSPGQGWLSVTMQTTMHAQSTFLL